MAIDATRMEILKELFFQRLGEVDEDDEFYVTADTVWDAVKKLLDELGVEA